MIYVWPIIFTAVVIIIVVAIIGWQEVKRTQERERVQWDEDNAEATLSLREMVDEEVNKKL